MLQAPFGRQKYLVFPDKLIAAVLQNVRNDGITVAVVIPGLGADAPAKIVLSDQAEERLAAGVGVGEGGSHPVRVEPTSKRRRKRHKGWLWVVAFRPQRFSDRSG